MSVLRFDIFRDAAMLGSLRMIGLFLFLMVILSLFLLRVLHLIPGLLYLIRQKHIIRWLILL